MESLRQRRNVLSSQARTCTGILPPIRRLAPEIIEDIFLHCLPPRRSRTPSRLKAPILPCQICSSWRRIALGLSELWEVLALCVTRDNIDEDGRTTGENSLSAAQEWFSRTCPDTSLEYFCQVQLTADACDEAPEIVSRILLPFTYPLSHTRVEQLGH
jgi:hypothetical protein